MLGRRRCRSSRWQRAPSCSGRKQAGATRGNGRVPAAILCLHPRKRGEFEPKVAPAMVAPRPALSGAHGSWVRSRRGFGPRRQGADHQGPARPPVHRPWPDADRSHPGRRDDLRLRMAVPGLEPAGRLRARLVLSARIDAVVWLVPVLIVLSLSVLVWRYSHRLDPYRPIAADARPLQVQAVVKSSTGCSRCTAAGSAWHRRCTGPSASS
jgi:hypothetical protein